MTQKALLKEQTMPSSTSERFNSIFKQKIGLFAGPAPAEVDMYAV